MNIHDMLNGISTTRKAYKQAIEDARQQGAALFKQVRMRYGLTQADLAGILQCDVTYLSKIENGHIPPGTPLLEKLERYIEGQGDYVE